MRTEVADRKRELAFTQKIGRCRHNATEASNPVYSMSDSGGANNVPFAFGHSSFAGSPDTETEDRR